MLPGAQKATPPSHSSCSSVISFDVIAAICSAAAAAAIVGSPRRQQRCHAAKRRWRPAMHKYRKRKLPPPPSPRCCRCRCRHDQTRLERNASSARMLMEAKLCSSSSRKTSYTLSGRVTASSGGSMPCCQKRMKPRRRRRLRFLSQQQQSFTLLAVVESRSKESGEMWTEE